MNESRKVDFYAKYGKQLLQISLKQKKNDQFVLKMA
jgi:hypothetical protein